MEEREPKLGVVVGKKGCGKTFLTTAEIRRYVVGNPAMGIPARRALIFDVNDEYSEFKALKISDVVRFSTHQTIEARRIRPFTDKGIRMTTTELQQTLFLILGRFRGGLLLIEDPNRYISDNLPNDLIGAIVTNRHVDLDVIMHFQSISRISPKIWQNINYLRFHKITTAVITYKDKYEDKLELFQLVEAYVNSEYDAGNKRVFVYVDIDELKIRNINRQKFEMIVDKYLSVNYNKLIIPLTKQFDIVSGKKSITAAAAVTSEKARIIKSYLD